MAYEVSRRNFMKGAAAMTVAAAASTLLAGCGGGGNNAPVAANEAVLGDYRVKVTLTDSDQVKREIGTGDNQKVIGYVKPTVAISYKGAGFTGLFFKDVFSAEMDEQKMTLNNPLSPIASADFAALNGVVSALVPYKPEFQIEGKELFEKYLSGKTDIKMKVLLDKETAVFTIKYDGTVTAAKV